jgi:hypothetical protein
VVIFGRDRRRAARLLNIWKKRGVRPSPELGVARFEFAVDLVRGGKVDRPVGGRLLKPANLHIGCWPFRSTARVHCDGWRYRSGTAARRGGGSSIMYTLFGIGLLIAVALLSKQEQRKGAWLLAAVVVVLVFIADRMR